MPLQISTLIYGSSYCPVKPTQTLPLPDEFNFANPEECAREIAAIMSNAAGGHPLRRVRLAIHPARQTANITANGAHVYYAPDNRPKLTAIEAAQLAAETTVTMLGDVETDQYGDGWKRARWIQPSA